MNKSREFGWAIYSWRNIIKVKKISFDKNDTKYRWEEGYMKGKPIPSQGISSKIIVWNKEDIPRGIETLKNFRDELHEYYAKYKNMEYKVENYGGR